MPVILEQITKVSSQDMQDLIKIYQHHPQLMSEDPAQWINHKLASGQRLLAGRFNGRLVGGLWATVDPDNWQLEHLCVRDITRRRGVATQLLTLLTHQANRQQINLTLQDSPACEPVRPLLMALGFTLITDTTLAGTTINTTQGSVWQKNHQQ